MLSYNSKVTTHALGVLSSYGNFSMINYAALKYLPYICIDNMRGL